MRIFPSLMVIILAACSSGPPAGTVEDLGVAPDLAPAAPPPPLTTTMACIDALTDVYTAPAGLPAYTPAERGKIVRCALDKTLSAADVQARAVAAGYVGPKLASGAQALRVAYRTERLAGQPGLATAEIYLPSAPLRSPVEAAVAAHGTIGLADFCAPTRLGGLGSDAMAMPLTGAGIAVIAPDYAGLGNGGGTTYHGYDIAEDEAHSVLDAVRALRNSVAAGALTDGTVLVGHSQGGGSVLAAQALAKSYGDGLTISGVIGFAPGWYDRRVWGVALEAMNRTVATGGAQQFGTAFGVMYFFAHAAVYDGLLHALDPFKASVRTMLKPLVDGHCIDSLGAQVAMVAPTLGDLYDPAFGASLEACLGGMPSCASPGKDWIARMDLDRPPLDSAGAPVLLIQGLADTTVPPSSTACALSRLVSENVPVQACTDANADHSSVVGAQAQLALQFLEAHLAGAPAPTCTNALPGC